MSENLLDEIRDAARALEADGKDIRDGLKDRDYGKILEDFNSTYTTGQEPGDVESYRDFQEELYRLEFHALLNHIREAEVMRR